MTTRRHFIRTVAALPFVGSGIRYARAAKPRHTPPRVAAIITEYRPLSHADVIVSRFIQGHILGTKPYNARTRIVSMYVDQFPRGDLARPMCAQYNIALKPTIADALTLGTDDLAVDGVLLIGEHGNYPHNDKSQHMYPRRRFFEKTVAVFEKTGRTAPVFNDKHMGYAWKDAKWMVDQSRRLDFPFMAGSSLPTTWRKPELEIPVGTKIEEALAIGYGGIESYGFHALETLQCMTERRAGGETGVKAVTCLEGNAVWDAGVAGRWSRPLLDAALAPVERKRAGDPEKNCPNPAAYLIEYTDGLRATVLMLDGHSTDFAFAARAAGRSDPMATLFWLQEPEYGHFAYLTHNIESMFLSGHATYPVERTLITTGILDAVMTSRFEGHRRIETPWMQNVTYKPTTRLVRRGSFRT